VKRTIGPFAGACAITITETAAIAAINIRK
jgi:hypothetical protein